MSVSAEMIVDKDGVKVWVATDPDHPGIYSVAQSKAEALDDFERTKAWVEQYEAANPSPEQPNTTLERP